MQNAHGTVGLEIFTINEFSQFLQLGSNCKNKIREISFTRQVLTSDTRPASTSILKYFQTVGRDELPFPQGRLSSLLSERDNSIR